MGKIPPSTQDLINGQEKGTYDITAGDYVTYIDNQVGYGAPKADLRIIAEASFLQPDVLALLVKGQSPITSVSQLQAKTVSVNAPNDIGTLLIDSLLVEHGIRTHELHYTNMPFPGVAAALTTPGSPVAASFTPGAVRQPGRGKHGHRGTGRSRPGLESELSDPGLCGHPGLGQEVPQHAQGVHHCAEPGPADRGHQPGRGGSGRRALSGRRQADRGVHLASDLPPSEWTASGSSGWSVPCSGSVCCPPVTARSR